MYTINIYSKGLIMIIIIIIIRILIMIILVLLLLIIIMIIMMMMMMIRRRTTTTTLMIKVNKYKQVFTFISYVVGPIGSVLLIRLGYRIVAVSGSVLAIVGFLSASFAPNIELLTFTYGAIAGKYCS